MVMLTRASHLPRLLVCLAIAAFAACGGGDKDQAKMKAAAESALASPHMAPAAAAPAPLTDANIVAILDKANANDSAGGSEAQKNGTSKDVKDFGRRMANDHHTLRQAGIDLAKKLNLTPQPPATDSLDMKAKHQMDHLSSMSPGAEWDKMYIDGEVQMHEAVLATATAAKAAAQNDSLKALIDKAAPVIEGHLTKARDIQKKLGGKTP
jgi:putative membrane protein